MRLPRRRVLGSVLAAASAVAATAWLIGGADSIDGRAPSPAPTARVTRAGPLTPEARVLAVRHATDLDPLLDLMASAHDDPSLRAMALTALPRHADDPRARGALVTSLAPDRPREERLLALTVLQGWPDRTDDRGWATPALTVAVADPDPQVRAAARVALESRGAGGGR